MKTSATVPCPGRFPRSSRGACGRAAFTILEVLVAMLVLVIVVLLVAQLMTSMQGTVGADNKRMDADAQARLVFDRVALDLAQMLPRDEVDFVAANPAGNDTLHFFSQSPGYYSATGTPQSPVSLVGYRINPRDPQTGESDLHLERLSKGLSWDQGDPGSVVFLTYPPPAGGSSPTPTPAPLAGSTIPTAFPATLGAYPFDRGNDADYHTLGGQVFRLEICFLARGEVRDRLTGVLIANAGEYFQLAANQSIKLGDLAAIVVTLAILDPASRGMVDDLTQAAAALPDPATADLKVALPNQPNLPSKLWQAKIDGGNFAELAGIPIAAAGQVRIYQRIFYLSSQ